MAKQRRPHRIQVKLSDAELHSLEARVGATGGTKADVMRSALEMPGPVAAEFLEVPSRERALALLAGAAEQGSVTAMASLERALRLGGEPPQAPRTGPVTPEELRQALRAI
jgi:hypothetical protein